MLQHHGINSKSTKETQSAHTMYAKSGTVKPIKNLKHVHKPALFVWLSITP